MPRHSPRVCITCGGLFTGPPYEYGCFVCIARALRHGLSDDIAIMIGAAPWLSNFSMQDYRNYGAEVLNALSSYSWPGREGPQVRP